MPLENNNKKNLSHQEKNLNHKEKILYDKVHIDTLTQEVPQSLFLPASLTIEAALVFPLFLFALAGVLFFFQVLQVTQVTSGALAATGSRLSLDTGEDTSIVTAAGHFYKELRKEEYPDSVIVGGNAGIGWSKTSLEGDYVDLQIQYLCRFPIKLFGVGNIPVTQRVYMKKWTGYHGDGQAGAEGDGTWVYITLNGEVYHRRKDCSYLQLSIKTIGKDEIGDFGYTSCMLCGGETTVCPYYYVTEDGLRYHTKLDCSGLKRTVYMVQLTEVADRRECSRCGKKF